MQHAFAIICIHLASNLQAVPTIIVSCRRPEKGRQGGRAVPVMHMDINPALPDLRRPFSGRAKSTYVIDVNGQGGYATGEVEAWWSESGPKVKVMPSAPEWTTDGDLVSSIVFRDEGFDVLVQKVSD